MSCPIGSLPDRPRSRGNGEQVDHHFGHAETTSYETPTVNLRGMRGRQTAAAVDAKADYKEINRGRLAAGVHAVRLGPTSDRVLAVGR